MAVTWDKQPASRAGVSLIFNTTGTSQQSSTFGVQTYQIRVATAAASAFIRIGNNPTATSTGNSMQLGTNTTDYFCVTPGQQVAVVQGSAAGTVSVTEMD
ncbi:MAG: hypothetical protein C5B58_13670 [Acidobacteria bacterium]|nr:MAG: hypothetical protein C5B58_13670 [Acidobacteriota bacterium]